jgi:excinuclease ABC subunit A
MSKADNIIIKGAKEHNLKNIDLVLPRNKLIVVTGLSGSGKSSLAFDTIYAEGQRRYVESLSSYARQFLEQLQKPNVEHIEGLSPAISIEQRTAGGNPRSTVATQTEIYDYLRLLFARIGKPHCYKCARPIIRQSSQEIINKILGLSKESKIDIFAPVIRGRKGEYRSLLLELKKQGFLRIRIDGTLYEFTDDVKLDKYKIHDIEVLIDKLINNPGFKSRIVEAVETALKIGKGIVIIKYKSQVTSRKSQELIFNEKYSCPYCDINLEEIEPRIFSFNSPYGACPACGGLGTKMEFDEDLVIPDKDKSIIGGAIEPWKRGGKGYILYYRALLKELASELGFSLDTPFKNLSQELRHSILYGADVYIWDKKFEGVIPNIERLFNKTDSEYLKHELSKYISQLPCPVCEGSRLKKESLAVTINKKSIWDLVKMPIKNAYEFFCSIELNNEESIISSEILKEIKRRLKFCIDVGLDYLTLDRKAQTLSGGEAQRIRLATQVGSGLVGVIYILDEPTIGLHHRDNQKLLSTLKSLRDIGNTLIVVEHDEETIRAADHVVDLGPGAGRLGGEVVFCGELKDLLKNDESLTAKYLNKKIEIKSPFKTRDYDKNKFIEIIGAREHNLKNINVKFPLGTFICVTGVSGSGKSTLVDEVFYRAIARKLYGSKQKPGEFKSIKGLENIDKVIEVDQSPIGRTPRSNPVTYTNVFSNIRDLFAKLPESKVRGYRPGRFSFNVKGGRCESCQGDGIKKIEMHFLPDVYVKCEVCNGYRFNEQTLEVKYKGKSISDVLNLSIEEALDLFENIPQIKNILKTLYDVGLGYIQLGQSATTLSGGEAQRIKLSKELSRRSTGKTLYILDEPTTGLHFADVDKLLGVLQRLVDKGNTVLVIEHNPDVIKCADYVIDLGPEGGDRGGEVIACGSPREIIKVNKSYTGQFLKNIIKYS